MSGTAAASADPAPPLFPSDTQGSITIHKYSQPTRYKQDNLGMELPPDAVAGLTPLPGAQFTARQVTGVDLSTNAGWREAQRIVDTFDPFDPESLDGTLGSARTKTTDGQGVARFGELPIGLYLVEETGAPPVAAGTTVTPAMPFLITIPLTDPANQKQWVFDVHAYPKNVLSKVEKTVIDVDTEAIGQTVDYTISSSIPGGSVTTKYVLTDRLDPKLEYRSSSVKIDGKTTTDFTSSHSQGVLVITLGAQARADAFAAVGVNPTAQVTADVVATAKESGVISNDATLTFERDGEWETEVPSPPVVIKFGGINIYKHNRENKGLSGAVFEVYSSHSNDFSTATPVTVNGKSQWTTGSDGRVVIDGLRYSGWANGEEVAPSSPAYLYYWLVEKQAPTGYELLPQPIPFIVDAPVSSAATVDVVNTPHNAGGELPLTGARGTAALAALGIALVGGGGASLLLTRSKRSALPAPSDATADSGNEG